MRCSEWDRVWVEVFRFGVLGFRFRLMTKDELGLVMMREEVEVEDDEVEGCSASVGVGSDVGGVGFVDVGNGGSGTNAESIIVSDVCGSVEGSVERSVERSVK